MQCFYKIIIPQCETNEQTKAWPWFSTWWFSASSANIPSTVTQQAAVFMCIFEVWPSCQWFMADQSVIYQSFKLHSSPCWTSSCTVNHCLWVIWGLNSLIIKTEKHPDFNRFKLHNFSSGLFRTSSVLLFICPNFKTEVCQRRCGRRDEI